MEEYTNDPHRESNLGMFKSNLVTFIENKTSARLEDKSNGFKVITPSGSNKGKKWALIYCYNHTVLYEIVNAFENDPYYKSKVSINDGNIHVSDYDKPHAATSVKAFFNKLKKLSQKNCLPVEILSPLFDISPGEKTEIELQFNNYDQMDSFIDVIDKDWLPFKKEENILSIHVTETQILNFLSGK